MEQLPLISVIVPVYKVEPYLEKCVNSIRNQTYHNLEILLVDDGSPDRCGEMCDEYAKLDPRIRVIHKENGGLSDARNAALDVIKGEYVGFVDSDDWIEREMYEHLYNLIIHTNSGIAACGVALDAIDGSVTYFNDKYPEEGEFVEFSLTEALRELTRANKITNSMCDKLFHRSVFSTIRMTVGIKYEDFQIMPSCLEQVQTVAYSPLPMYHYVQRLGSTTKSSCSVSRFTEVELSRVRVKHYQENYPELYDDVMAAHVVICMNTIYESFEVEECKQLRKQLIKELRYETCVTRRTFGLLKRKEKLKYATFCVSPTFFTLLLRRYHGSREEVKRK